MKRVPPYLREIARTAPGFWTEAAVQCLKCAFGWTVTYTAVPLYFRCPRCASTRGVRDHEPFYHNNCERIH